MLSAIFTFICYGFFGSCLVAYIVISFLELSSKQVEKRYFYLNGIIVCLIAILFIFILAWLERFENLNSISDLINNISWVIFNDFGVALKYGWLGATAPTITIFILIALIVCLTHAFISSIYFDSAINSRQTDLYKEVGKLRQDVLYDQRELKTVNEARSEAISLLEDTKRDLSKKTLELAQNSSKNNKYIQFYNDNSHKIANLDNALETKNSKIADLEEIIKRRDLQIQRLKKSRKESK